MMSNNKNSMRTYLIYIAAFCMAFVMIIPLLWMIVSAFKAPGSTVTVITELMRPPYTLDSFKEVFSLFADIDNYPIYMHCTGGADRTGTVAFLLNALLGVSETELIHDYEFTSFSVYGQRNSIDGTEYGGMFQEFLKKLKSFEGATLAEKTETYMLSIGVTQEEIDSIRTIMLGE